VIRLNITGWLRFIYHLIIKMFNQENKILTVSEVYCKGKNVNFKEGCGASTFWLRKTYWWEK
jgi:hypothetical protein